MGGNDTLEGDQGNDKLYGDDGRDVPWGSYDHDRLFGQAGNDTFYAGTNDHLETDFCSGGTGSRDRNPDGDCDTSRSIP